MRSILVAAAILCGLCAGALAAPRLGNHTQLSFGPGHGTKVEYLASDGSAWLWHAGNRVVLPGGWKLEEGDICFRHGTGNPVGGTWNCIPYELYKQTIRESRSGDIFALKGRQQVPFALPRQPLSIDQLKALAKTGKALSTSSAD